MALQVGVLDEGVRSIMVITVSRCIMAREAGSSTAMTGLACPAQNSAAASISTAIGRGPLAHADHHRAVAEHVHVAALDGGGLVVRVVVAVVA